MYGSLPTYMHVMPGKPEEGVVTPPELELEAAAVWVLAGELGYS